jgi:hypothetical protein
MQINNTTPGAPPAPTLSRIVVNANKRPVFAWKVYQERPATPDEIREMWSHQSAHGEAIVCGPVSGGLEVIDIDTKNDPAGTLHNDFFSLIPDEIRVRLYIVQTRSGGAHVYYRCAHPAPNQKLAQRKPTAAERLENPAARELVTIETRGAGGYVVCPPSPGYTVIQGSPDEIPFLTDAERNELLSLARSFTEIEPEPEPLLPRSQQGGSLDTGNPFKDYNEAATPETIREILTAAGWKHVYSKPPRDYYLRPGKTDSETSGDYHTEKKLFAVFSTNAAPFEPEKGYTPAAVLNALEFAGDWKATAAHLRNLGCGKPLQGERLKAVNKAADLIRANKPDREIITALQKYADSEESAREIIQQAETLVTQQTGDFWQFTAGGAVKFDYTKFYNRLQEWGFYRLADSGGTYIQIEGRIVREVEPGFMAAAVFRFLQEAAAPAEVENQFRKQAPQMLSDSYLKTNLEARAVSTLRDTAEHKFLPFLNGLAVMDQTGAVRVAQYSEAPAYIWETHIIQRTFDPDPEFVWNPAESEFYRFLQCIAGERNHKPTDETPRAGYAVRTFGFLCDTNKEKARPWAVILSEETADDNKGGGTGKGLFMHGVNQAAPVVTIPGKEWNPDSRFAFSRVKDSTRVLFFDDVSKRFSLEALNNAITEGLRIENKGKDERFLPFADAPKIAVSTNYAVELEAAHAARRARVMEFATYFGPGYTPLQEFGHLLFEDWDQHEWNRFYNLVFFAVWQYRTHREGLEIKAPSELAERKAARIKYTREFVEWITEAAPELAGKEKARADVYTEFLQATGMTEKEYSKRRFIDAMEKAGRRLGLDFTSHKKTGGYFYRFDKPGAGL